MKPLLVSFNGEMLCFVHVLLNALDMNARGMEPGIIFEGASVKLVPQLVKEDCPFNELYNRAKQEGLILGACKACSNKMKVLGAVKSSGLPLLDGMTGHPSLGEYMEQGYTVMTF